jgi:phosphatidylserine/phosphatidylglycerophosphate/cardiolipin synthase-like enzyme
VIIHNEENIKMRRIVSALLVCALAISPAYARKNAIEREIEGAVNSFLEPQPIKMKATGEVEVGFSPNAGAEKLVIKALDSAKSSIRLQAYSFTSAPVVSALLRANKRGVDVAIVVDEKSNLADGNTKSKAALSSLATAGVAVRTNGKYAILHDKLAIIDKAHVQGGSFNYSSSANSRNSENVIVHWNNPQLAAAYLKHWERNWREGTDFKPRY